jgi:hypothetical protein
MAESSQLDEQVAELYGLRPGAFVPARDALAKRLRGDGRRAEADAVKALPRPTVAAWAVNQLVRREPEWTQALATAGRRLEEAQAALLEGGDRAAWRGAVAAQREAIDRLARLAERLVREERGSVSGALREQIRETLQAATVDAEARAAVCAGRLTRELRATGLLGAGAGAGVPGSAPAPADSGSPPPAPPRRTRTRPTPPATADREARAARRAAEREARAALRRAEREATAAQAAADRAAKAAARARKANDAASAALADAEEAARQRAAELAAAEEVERRASDALAERTEAVRRARDAVDRATTTD